jgi:hypothetical protein
LLKLKDVGATTCRGAAVFDNYSESNEEYLSFQYYTCQTRGHGTVYIT